MSKLHVNIYVPFTYSLDTVWSRYAATVATLHYARAIMHGVRGACLSLSVSVSLSVCLSLSAANALCGAGELAAARAEQVEFEAARASPSMAERVIHNNGLPAIMAVGAESECCLTHFLLLHASAALY
eukprot:COSAG03_NODE_3366_length_2057_cov_3.284985_2_plen_128_part_00